MSLANPTLEDIWKLFQKSDRKSQEMRQLSKETDKRINKVSA